MGAGPSQTETLQKTAEPMNHPGGTSRGAYLRKGEKCGTSMSGARQKAWEKPL